MTTILALAVHHGKPHGFTAFLGWHTPGLRYLTTRVNLQLVSRIAEGKKRSMLVSLNAARV
jgi:hypothetical protein